MQVNKAKDVLVNEIVQQASLEGSSLSDLERCMLYFTESGDCPEDPIQLNDDFEVEHDTPECEAKIPGLMKRAYHRLKQENATGRRLWDEAVSELNKGDHYILVMVQQSSNLGALLSIQNLFKFPFRKNRNP